tara:strand:+ start:139311 stop:140258 length:948 start_codon:yes stop_codon:yes gene_type:complete
MNILKVLNINEITSFAEAAFNTFDTSKLSIDPQVAMEELKEDIVSELEDLNSEQTKKARLDHFQVEGTSPDDYSERLLDLDNNRKVIYGIRHKGGNKEIPFIQFTPNFKINSKSEVLEIYEQIKTEFKVFNPLYVSLFSREKVDADLFGSVYMVSTAEKFKELAPWKEEAQVKIELITNDSYYDWYKSGYDQFHADYPQLKNKVTVNSKELMRESLDEGLLKLFTIDGEKVGLIGAEKSKFLGHDGLYFNEIYIEKNWKGKGLAKAMQRIFVASSTKGHELIWGTINDSNIPSYKTAYSNGRRAVRFECFFSLRL